MKRFRALLMTATLLASAHAVSAMSPPSAQPVLVAAGQEYSSSNCPLLGQGSWLGNLWQNGVTGWQRLSAVCGRGDDACCEAAQDVCPSAQAACRKNCSKPAAACCVKGCEAAQAQKCCCAKACSCCESCKASQTETATPVQKFFPPMQVGVKFNFLVTFKGAGDRPPSIGEVAAPLPGFGPLPMPYPMPGPHGPPSWVPPLPGVVPVPGASMWLPFREAVQDWIASEPLPMPRAARPNVCVPMPGVTMPADPTPLEALPSPYYRVGRTPSGSPRVPAPVPQAHLVTPDLEAHCERMTHTGNVIVLEGDVRLVCKKNGQQIRIEAHRVLLNVKDGTFTVESDAQPTSTSQRNVAPACHREQTGCDVFEGPCTLPVDRARTVRRIIHVVPVPTQEAAPVRPHPETVPGINVWRELAR